MQSIIAVAVGGFIGTLLRYAVSCWYPAYLFPWDTLMVNLIGSFGLGLLTHASGLSLHPQVRLGLGTGLIGSFTTFSTFSAEWLSLPFPWAIGYGSLSMLGGLGCAWLGALAGKGRSAC
ncbi:fluoride efflux transporter FluC [Laceyella putida]|uniref:Fluoride-specific ion channel FluC n=1 Tax=Laceyella putida TaxID=110101 RepID=A0ABW2RNF5_9BACL